MFSTSIEPAGAAARYGKGAFVPPCSTPSPICSPASAISRRTRCAGLTADPADYPWSSYGSNGLGRRDPLVTPHATYRALGRSADIRRANYRALVLEALDRETLAAVRTSVQQGWALGGERFRAGVRHEDRRDGAHEVAHQPENRV